MSYSIQTPDTYIAMPWKNGKGQTIELLKEDIDNDGIFSWRLSQAQVSTDGAFSLFREYERTLVLLSGVGMTLEHQHSPPHILTDFLQVARFSGAEKTTASLHNGPIEDFNIMTKKDACRATVITCENDDIATVDNCFDLLLIYPVSSDLMISSRSGGKFILQAQHLLHGRNVEECIELAGGPFIAIGIDGI